jgi:hypothetical protein
LWLQRGMVQAIMLLMVLLANSASQSLLIHYLTVLTTLMQSTKTSRYPVKICSCTRIIRSYWVYQKHAKQNKHNSNRT